VRALILLVLAAPAAAAGEFPRPSAGVVLDARLAAADGGRGWLDAGLGKTRYGGGTDGARTLARVSQASVLLGLDFSEALRIRLQANLDAEPGGAARQGRLDLIEAYAQYQPALTPSFRLRARAGMFFPPLSLEHDGPAWTTTYTITPSAVNTWIGEEVRSTGAELMLGAGRERTKVSATAAVFGWNDPAGTLLAWRGWALHDRQTGRPDRLPLAALPSIGPGRAFDKQPSWSAPLREVDDRAGFYAGAELRLLDRLRLRALRWDNRGDVTALRSQQYAWATRMDAWGLALELPAGVALLAQHMSGQTLMGRMPDGATPVGAYPRARYVMLTATRGRHRLTVRWDSFSVEEDDALPQLDDNREDGTAWTGAYLVRVGERHRVGVEVVHVESTRPVRAALGLSPRQRETLVQASLRLRF
jgi:hypothetical protein